jgi:hypothetical protein
MGRRQEDESMRSIRLVFVVVGVLSVASAPRCSSDSNASRETLSTESVGNDISDTQLSDAPPSDTPIEVGSAEPEVSNQEIPAGTPCLEFVPAALEYGAKLVGTIACLDLQLKPCGTVPVAVNGMAFREGTNPAFAMDCGTLSPKTCPNPAAPLSIPPNLTETVKVCYTPTQAMHDAEGNPIRDTGAVVVDFDGPQSPIQVEVSGFGVESECPQPIIVIEEGEEVIPQTVMHLHGDQSQSGKPIISYAWRVEQPSDSLSNLVPSASVPNPTHEVNVAGSYTYCLDVCNDVSCSNDVNCHTTACKDVVVISDNAIHCELTWKTPGDSNQFDEGQDVGADMDLHFAHPFASGPDIDGDGKPDGWFDIPYDCFWFNSHPDWESMNPNANDDPRMDRDDTDGAGPENLNLDVPKDGRIYRIGVHYWDDHGFGASYPRLKCYIWSQLVFDRELETLGQKLNKCDMWEVATIAWPAGTTDAVMNPDGSLKITPHYMNPAFVTVGGGGCN